MPTPDEYLKSIQSNQGRLVAKKSDKQSRVGKFVTKATSPLIDAPDIPFAPNFVNRGIESATSPLGLAGTLLAPVTGGASSGLVSVLAREALLSAVAGTAAEGAADLSTRYTGPGANLLRIGAPIGAAIATGRVGSRALGGRAQVARIKELEAMDALTDPTSIADPVDKIAFYIRNAKQSTKANELLRAPERARRAGRVAGILESGGYSRGSIEEATRALAGKLPNERFLTDEFKITDVELTAALKRIDGAGLLPLERLNAATSLLDVVDSGAMPTVYEAKLLARVYGEDFVASIMKHRTKPEIWRQHAYDLIGLPRALRASMDLSAPLRQGILLIGSPKQFFGAIKPMMRAFANEDYAQKMISSMKDDPYYKQAVENGLELTDLSNITLAANPEEYFTRLPSVIGGTALGAGVKASERAYTVYLNKLRFDKYKAIAQHWESMGPTAFNSKNLQDIAEFLNYATGRGKLPKDLARLSPALNATIFAPKFLYSRFAAPGTVVKRTMNMIRQDPSALSNPAKLKALYDSDVVLQEMLRNTGAFIGLGIGVLGAAKLAGLELESNPRSSEFGRIKIGNTKFDMWAGYQPLVRYAAQIFTGERKTGTGGTQDADRLDTFTRLVRSKESPIAGLIHDFYAGQTFTGDEIRGDEVDIATQLANAFTPLFIADLSQNLREEGVIGGIYTAPAFFGLGVQSYSSLRDRQNEVGIEMFGKEYRELTAKQQDAVNKDERVVVKELQSEARKSDYRDAHAEIVQERLDNEGLAYTALQLGRMSPKDFADSIADFQKKARAKDDQAQADFGVTFPDPVTPLAKALDGWYDLFRQADIGASSGIETGVIDWNVYDQLEDKYIKGLTPEERAFIENRRRAPHNKNIEWYYTAKDYINKSKYYDTADDTFERYSSRAQGIDPNIRTLADLETVENLARQSDPVLYKRVSKLLNQIAADSSKKKERLRKQDPKLDWALFETGRTSKLLNKSLTKSPYRTN